MKPTFLILTALLPAVVTGVVLAQDTAPPAAPASTDKAIGQAQQEADRAEKDTQKAQKDAADLAQQAVELQSLGDLNLLESFQDGKDTKPFTFSLDQSGEWSPDVNLFFSQDGVLARDKRVNLDLDNATLKDALKQLFTQVKHDYAVDSDVYDDWRITIHAKNVRFMTALDLITQAAGVGWRMEMHRGNDSKTTTRFRFGKSLQASSGGFQNLFVNPRPGQKGTDYPNTLQALGAYNKALVTAPDNLSFITSFTEQRSTFTCPHCKGQVTVIRSRQQPKCPRCGRTFEASWQFCPFDGAKRPPTPGAWKYCPLCGKEIDFENDGKHEEKGE